MFFPGFLFSLLLTILWAYHHFAGEAQAPLAGIVISFYIGLLSAIVGLIYKLVVAFKKHKVQER